MDLSKLKKSGPNYYQVRSMLMTYNSIRTLLLCADLTDAGVGFCSLDFRIIDLCKKKLIDTLVNKDGKVITFITNEGWIYINELRNLNIERD